MSRLLTVRIGLSLCALLIACADSRTTGPRMTTPGGGPRLSADVALPHLVITEVMPNPAATMLGTKLSFDGLSTVVRIVMTLA